MKDITTSEYFFYGCADYSEFSEIKSQYALYDPTSERFVLTSKFPNVLQLVATLFSGKISLRVCRLHTASNFTPNLLDNTCCTNWTLKNKDDILISRTIDYHITDSVYNVQEIIPSKPLDGPELIIDNIEFLMATYHWVSHAETGRSVFFGDADPFYRTELVLNGLMDLPLEITPTVVKMRTIHSIIFNETDYAIAKEKVESLIKGFRGLME